MPNKKQAHTLPPNNPFLIQNSVYPMVHFDPAQTDVSTRAVELASDRLRFLESR
jgi:hypothetical protein